MNISLQAQLTGHKSAIYALCGALNPQACYSADGNGYIVYWDNICRDEGVLLAQVPSNVFSLHFLLPFNCLAVGSMQGIVYSINTTDQRGLPTALQLPPPVFAIATYNHNLLVGAGNGSLYIIDPSTWQSIRSIAVGRGALRQIALHPFLPLAAVACSDASIYIIDLNNYKVLQRLISHKSSIFSVYFNATGNYLYAGSRDAHLSIWQVAANFELYHNIPAHLYTVNSIVGSPDGQYIVTGSRDKTIKIWNAATFQLLKVISPDKYPTKSHIHSVNSLLYLPDKKYLVSGGDDKQILVWQMDFEL